MTTAWNTQRSDAPWECRHPPGKPFAILFLAALVFAVPRFALAQSAVGGVYIDPEGILRQAEELSSREQQVLLGKAATPSDDVARASDLRKISLRKLEAAVAAAREGSAPRNDDLIHLAGLYRIDLVWVDRENHDVILAGPAEAWEQTAGGDIVGRISRRPVLTLDDLIIALRYAFPEGQTDDFIGCSIDPTPEGIAALERMLRGNASATAAGLGALTARMERALGPQQISVFGVPADSRFALKLVAADYRLKRLALGHDPSPVKQLTSYLDLTARHPPAGKAPQHRWWFVARPDVVRCNSERTLWKFDSDGVAVQTARTGGKSSDDEPRPASREAQQFADSVTRCYPDLARAIPVFAELGNLIALALVAEIVHQAVEYDRDERPHDTWRPDHLLDRQSCPVAVTPVPRQLPAMVNTRRARGGAWVFAISGGVEYRPEGLLRDAGGLDDDPAAIVDRLEPAASDGRWWWD